MTERRDSLYGRRKGKPLSPRRAGLMATLFRERAIDISEPSPDSLAALFPNAPERIALEIGFGGGEHLIAAATAEPHAGFIGVEPYLNGMASAVAAIHDAGLANIRLFDGDAAHLLDWLPPASLTAVDLLYPDPWPKKRHWKRRFVSPENLDRLARALKPGGSLPLRQRHPLLCRVDASPHAPPSRFCVDRRACRRLALALSRLAGHAL